jgi:signal transduction histidine kinase
MHLEPSRARPDLDDRTGLRSYIATPLIWREERLGVLTVGAPEPHALNSADAELFAELAEQAAAAVAHAHAYTQEQARREELEVVNAALSHAQRKLIDGEKQSALGQLAHGIAHELNTPLGVIISNLSVLGTYTDALTQVATASKDTIQRLRAGEHPDEIATGLEEELAAAELEYLLEDLPALASESAESAKRVASIVRSVAVFARASSDTLTPVSVEEALESAITLAWNELKHRGDLVRAYAAAGPVLGNMTELTQLFVHLLLNAAQALDDRSGSVTVSIKEEGAGVAVRITDTGRGIDPEHMARIFDPFFTTRVVGEGTGMGLAVCRGIVTRHGGTIEVESQPGNGTTFIVRLLHAPAQEVVA